MTEDRNTSSRQKTQEDDVLWVDSYDYDLPADLIAQRPAEPRDASRLLVLERETGSVAHRKFTDLLDYITASDVLVLNDTRVLPARLLGHKQTGGKAEVLLLRPLGGDDWEALVKPARRLQPGTTVLFQDPRLVVVIGETAGNNTNTRRVTLQCDGPQDEILASVGQLPLPPYIHAEPEDPQRYQTVFANVPGSAAAPTAGLHFTPELLAKLAERGTKIVYVTLHVGLDTFRPVTADHVTEHVIHREAYSVSPETAAVINEVRAQGGRCFAVGTTTCRTLESAVSDEGFIQPRTDETSLFIYPGYRFRAVDVLITNFHLPRSSLLMLVSAFAGKANIEAAYQQAIRHQYRFFSFGDAMLLL